MPSSGRCLGGCLGGTGRALPDLGGSLEVPRPWRLLGGSLAFFEGWKAFGAIALKCVPSKYHQNIRIAHLWP